VVFFAPEMAFSEAQEHLPSILEKRGVLADPALKQLDRLRMFVESVPAEVYRGMEALAKERLDGRDDEDWPILALALTLGCPIWTEDTDFFGCGAPTWTTNRIEIFFAEIAK
jgi:predicted nucleic acid-binding protein